MKTALVSFHNAYNYGAALQAYALQCAVRRFGADCEYVNYQNFHRKHAYDLKYQFIEALKNKRFVSAVKSLVGIPVLSLRGKRFDRFYARNLLVTDRVFTCSEEAKQLNGAYDKFVVGSDQVWNYTNNGGDTAFLLDFVEDDSKKISYSSSFGVSSLPDEISARYAENLTKFARLAVRESIGVEIVEKIAGRKAHLVLDPVFLTGKEEWEKIRAKCKPCKKKYIFCYTNQQNQIKDFLNTGFVTEEDLHVLSTHLSVKEALSRRIKTRITMAPEEFLNEISGAELVVTASFHCLAMAIIYHKPFMVILTGDHGKEERIVNLLKITGLESRVLKSTTTADDVRSAIDYDAVDERLKPHLERSREYLRRALFDEPDIPFDSSFQNRYFCMDSRCTGCSACAAVCPGDAITMRRDEEGFLIPLLDPSKCVRCYQCHSVCQVYTEKKTVEKQYYYGVKNADEIRKESSSGGMFVALANEIFHRGGVVCGAAMDKDWHVHHVMARSVEEIAAMHGTYYVQSEIGDSYVQIKEALKNGMPVLFIGTACQVQGLKDYLRSVPDNLYICDIICHGAPSPMVFEQFIEMMKSKGKLTDFRFRDKRLGWKGYHVSAQIGGKTVKDKLWLQSFINLFSHNRINRLCCGSCQYTNYNRPGDLTIGDFWGIEKTHRDFMDSLGVSLVITNSAKGEQLFEALNKGSVLQVQKEETVQNSLLHPAPISAKRMQVFQTLRRSGYEKMIKCFAEVNTKGYLKNIVRKIIMERMLK